MALITSRKFALLLFRCDANVSLVQQVDEEALACTTNSTPAKRFSGTNHRINASCGQPTSPSAFDSYAWDQALGTDADVA